MSGATKRRVWNAGRSGSASATTALHKVASKWPRVQGRNTDGNYERWALRWTDVAVGSVASLIVVVSLSRVIVSHNLSPKAMTLTMLVVTALGGIVAAVIATLDHPRRRRASLGLRSVAPRALLFAASFGIAYFALTVVARWLIGDDSYEGISLAGYLSGSAVEILALVALIGVVLPATEEVLYRGLWFGGLRRYLSFWIAAPISAILPARLFIGAMLPTVDFGNDVLTLALPLLLGLWAAAVYELVGSLWPAMAFHIAINMSGLLWAAVNP